MPLVLNSNIYTKFSYTDKQAGSGDTFRLRSEHVKKNSVLTHTNTSNDVLIQLMLINRVLRFSRLQHIGNDNIVPDLNRVHFLYIVKRTNVSSSFQGSWSLLSIIHSSSSCSYRISGIYHIICTLTASLAANIKCSSMQALGHTKHDVRRAIVSMYAIVVKGFVNRQQILAGCCPGCPRRTGNRTSTSLRGGSFRESHSFPKLNKVQCHKYHLRCIFQLGE